jgi:SH3-like domain-containing protein
MESVRAIAAHAVSERPPIQLAMGDEVLVGERDTEWPSFVFVTVEGGAGWVPSRHLSADAGPATVVMAYDTTELATEVGDVLDVVTRDDPSEWLWCRAPDGREGWVPSQTLIAQARSL